MRHLPLLLLVLIVGCSHPRQHVETSSTRALRGDTLNWRTDPHNVFVQLDTLLPYIHLLFSADSMFEGAPFALDVLAERNILASFFFTGNFLREPANEPIINRIISEGHYVGPHSDGHILLADWDRDRTPLVTNDSLETDMQANLTRLAHFGVTLDDIPFALPPFEWCNRIHAQKYRQMGLIPINPTPEIETYSDFTTPDMSYYRSSEYMLNQLFDQELKTGLNGALIIIHLGTQPARTDKLYHHLPTIIDTLTARGYHFHPLPPK